MTGFSRHGRLLLALASAACTANNPAFGLSTDGEAGTGDGTGAATSTGAPGVTTGTDPTAAPTTGPDPSTTATTTPATTSTTTGTASGSTTAEPGTTSSTGTTGPEPFCGDGVQDPGEACDDGNKIDGDGCEANCSLPTCGDDIQQAGEECDDGNNTDNDGCSATCLIEVCGDGVIQPPEACDDGDVVPGDGCSGNCQIEKCGNGLIDVGEECDDGNPNNDDSCTAMCKKAKCGDGFVQPPELCDDGNAIDNDACKNNCTPGPCGDQIWDLNTEECDLSAEPFKSNPELCTEACKLTTCAKITNTGDTDIQNNSWFDKCVEAVGNTFTMVVITQTKQVAYKGSGLKGAWTYDFITSPAGPTMQWDLMTHSPIGLANTDRLYIFGRAGKPLAVDKIACPSSLGDGYGLAVLPKGDSVIKLLLMSTIGPNTGKIRNFNGWSGATELSYNNGQGMGLCGQPPGPIAATGYTAYFLVK